MFFGAVPTECIEQVFRVTDFTKWKAAYVCCSGSFRIERALRTSFPNLPIYSNDVALYSTAIGRLSAGQPFEVGFKGKLAFVEDYLKMIADENKQDSFTRQVNRTAAVLVACEMSRFARKNLYAQKHYAHFESNFAHYHSKAVEKINKLLPQQTITDYFAGDWREHYRKAFKEDGAGILAFPPFFKGDYEHQYRFIDENTVWDSPSYDLYDPKMLGDILEEIHASGSPYVLLSDQHFEGHKPVISFVTGRKVPHFCYSPTDKSSIRELYNRPEPFKYTPIDAVKLTEKTKVQIVPTDGVKLNFLKDVYLAKGIRHTPGVANYLIYLDKMLVGGIIYSLPKYGAYGPGAIYLLYDVTLTRDAKLSKLVAVIATSKTLLDDVGRKIVNRIDTVVTTARTKNPISMKYRGIYELRSRRPSDEVEGENIIQYVSGVRPQTPQELYAEWWKKSGRKDVEQLKNRKPQG